MSASFSMAMSGRRRERAQYAVLASGLGVGLATDTVKGDSKRTSACVPLKEEMLGSGGPRASTSRRLGTRGTRPALFVAGIVRVSTRVPAPRIVRSMRVSPSSVRQAGADQAAAAGVIALLLAPAGRVGTKRSRFGRTGLGGRANTRSISHRSLSAIRATPPQTRHPRSSSSPATTGAGCRDGTHWRSEQSHGSRCGSGGHPRGAARQPHRR